MNSLAGAAKRRLFLSRRDASMTYEICWSLADLSMHERMQVISGLSLVESALGSLGETTVEPIVPLHGGAKVIRLYASKSQGPQKRLAKQWSTAAIAPGIAYASFESLTVSLQRISGSPGPRLDLAGVLTQQTHALLLTALGGLPKGIRLEALGIRHPHSARLTLDNMRHGDALLSSSCAGMPIVEDTLAPLLEHALHHLRDERYPPLPK